MTDVRRSGTANRIEIQTEVVELDDVIRYFVRGYQKSAEITNHEYFVDSAKGKVVIRLYVRRAEKGESE